MKIIPGGQITVEPGFSVFLDLSFGVFIATFKKDSEKGDHEISVKSVSLVRVSQMAKFILVC